MNINNWIQVDIINVLASIDHQLVRLVASSFVSVSLNKSNAMNSVMNASFEVFNDILNYSWINLTERLERISTLFKGPDNEI